MNNEIKEYPKEQQKLKDYLDNVTIEQIIDKLKDDDGMTWWVDYQDQYQPDWKKIYAKEVQLLLDYITNLQKDLRDACEVIEQLKKDKLKAIEYIKHYGNLYMLKDKQFKNSIHYQKLLDILKGEDK